MQRIEEYVDLKYPDRKSSGSKKETTAKAKPVVAVASGSPGLKTSQGKYTLDNLDEYAKEAFQRIRNSNPKFTVDEYITLRQRGKR